MGSNTSVIPKVSIMMACLNAENYINKAIESVLNQSFIDFELIVVDDGSTDKSRDIVKEYAKNDSRIQLFENDGNKGLVYTRNRMLELARGEYLAVLDADDISTKDRLDVEVRFLDEHPEVVGVSSEAMVIDSKDSIIGRISLPVKTSREVRAWFLFDDVIINSTSMFRKSIVDKYRLKYKSGFIVMQDYEFFSRFIMLGDWNVIRTPLVYYRMLESSISHNMDDKKKRLTRKLEFSIKERYANALGIKTGTKHIRKVIKSTSKFREKKRFFEKFDLFFSYTRLIYDARGLDCFNDFSICAAKMWRVL